MVGVAVVLGLGALIVMHLYAYGEVRGSSSRVPLDDFDDDDDDFDDDGGDGDEGRVSSHPANTRLPGQHLLRQSKAVRGFAGVLPNALEISFAEPTRPGTRALRAEERAMMSRG